MNEYITGLTYANNEENIVTTSSSEPPKKPPYKVLLFGLFCSIVAGHKFGKKLLRL